MFPLLTNGGFEELRGDGTPYAWRKIGGHIESTESPVASGRRSLSLTSAGTASTKWAYQGVTVSGGRYYEASALASVSDPGSDAVFLRVSWYESDDTSGEAIENEDSIEALGPGSGDWRSLSTGPIEAPAEAHSARVRLMLRPFGEAAATAYFDSVRFGEVAAPTDPPRTPTPTPTPTSTPRATQTAVLTPTATRSATLTPGPTAAPSLTPTASPSPEPKVFPELTNGGFEVSRDDGTPYAWSRTGGEIAASDAAAIDGALGLELVSRTTATKWAYQTVAVQPGAFYEASAWAMNGAGVESATVRVSWYASASGEGQALTNDDSGTAESADGVFHYLTTEAIQAPLEAHSAKVRLLVRPSTGATAVTWFDSASFGRVEAPKPEPEPEATTARPTAPTRGASGNGGPGQTPVNASNASSDQPAVREVPSLANIRPAPVVLAASESPRADGDDGISARDAFLAGLIGLPLMGIGGIFVQDLWAQLKRGK